MKKLLVPILGFACALALTVSAGEGKKEHKKLTSDQRKELKELKDKYDTNKDGKLDKEEKAKMSAEDKAKWDAAFPHKKKEEAKKPETK